jgi:hypothetical protein
MRLFWIILGILVLVWLGFLHFSDRQIRLDLDRNEHRMDGYEEQYNAPNGTDNNQNVGEEAQDETNDAGENIQQGILPDKEQKLEQDIQQKKEELKEEKQEKKDEAVPPKKDVETSLPKDASGFLNLDSVVAFNSNYTESQIAFKQLDTPTLMDFESQEAYKLLEPTMFLSLN